LLSTIDGISDVPSFQYIVWFVNFATELREKLGTEGMEKTAREAAAGRSKVPVCSPLRK
jgi:hypothetical protein